MRETPIAAKLDAMIETPRIAASRDASRGGAGSRGSIANYKTALVVVLLAFCVAKSVKHIERPVLVDFRVYETASVLVREHRSLLIYDQADTGVDPQERFAPEPSMFAAVARTLGQSKTQLYVYPPLLADLLVPFTYMRAASAGRLWIVVNVLALLGIALLTLAMLKIRWLSWGAVAVMVAFFSFYPTISCLYWGQIAILLFLLWTLGIYFYGRGWIVASAAVFALAAAIKLTPILAAVPFLLWREWRWVRAYAVALLGLLVLVCMVNGPQCVGDFAWHVVPPMAGGVVLWSNRSLQASFEMLYVAMMGHKIEPGAYVSHTFVQLGKMACAVVGLAAVVLVARHRERANPALRERTLVMFAMLAVTISPVSWEHGYVVCLLALVSLWAEALRTETSYVFLAGLTVVSLEFSWFFFSYIVVHHMHGAGVGLASFLTPVCAIALVFHELARRSLPPLPVAATAGPIFR